MTMTPDDQDRIAEDAYNDYQAEKWEYVYTQQQALFDRFIGGYIQKGMTPEHAIAQVAVLIKDWTGHEMMNGVGFPRDITERKSMLF